MRHSTSLRHATARATRRGLVMGFNMVTLMDIFTILVFFLLVNSGDVYQQSKLPEASLPASVSMQRLDDSPVILVHLGQIAFDGTPLGTLTVGAPANPDLVAALHLALTGYKESTDQRKVTIVADKTVPYKLLKQILDTCRDADYTGINLAVLHETAN